MKLYLVSYEYEIQALLEEYTKSRHLTLYHKRKKNLGLQESFNSGCRKGAQVEKLISERCNRNQAASN